MDICGHSGDTIDIDLTHIVTYIYMIQISSAYEILKNIWLSQNKIVLQNINKNGAYISEKDEMYIKIWNSLSE